MTASLCLAATAAVTATHLAAVIDCESERERGCQLLTEPGQPAERALIPALSPPSRHPAVAANICSSSDWRIEGELPYFST